jgi:hypothetical protein
MVLDQHQEDLLRDLIANRDNVVDGPAGDEPAPTGDDTAAEGPAVEGPADEPAPTGDDTAAEGPAVEGPADEPAPPEVDTAAEVPAVEGPADEPAPTGDEPQGNQAELLFLVSLLT